jgi:tetratricopeptide (TPR) repeat protein
MFLSLIYTSAIPARAQTPKPAAPSHQTSADLAARKQLAAYMADFKSNPDDALRGKIIALAQTIRPAPAIPEEAREHYVMAATFMESAKDATGFGRAVEQYKAALLIAPWWADAYEKLATAQKAAEQYDDAVASLNLYLLFKPADARDAQDEIYKLKALKQAAADDQVRKQQEEQQKQAEAQQRQREEQQRQAEEQQRQREEQQRAYEASPEGIAARKRQDEQQLVARLNGTRFTCGSYHAIEVRGSQLVLWSLFTDGNWKSGPPLTLDGLESSWSNLCLTSPGQGHDYTFRAVISSDGNSIDVHGGLGACGSVLTYRLNGGGDCNLWCETGRPVTISGGFYCAN